jgi:hypothetical protein
MIVAYLRADLPDLEDATAPTHDSATAGKDEPDAGTHDID